MKKAFAIIMLLTVLLLSACNSTEVPQNSYGGTEFQQTEASATATDDETMTPENVTEAANNSSSQPVTETSKLTTSSTEETVKKTEELPSSASDETVTSSEKETNLVTEQQKTPETTTATKPIEETKPIEPAETTPPKQDEKEEEKPETTDFCILKNNHFRTKDCFFARQTVLLDIRLRGRGFFGIICAIFSFEQNE